MTDDTPLVALTPADSLRLWQLDQRCFPPGIAYSESEIREVLLQAGRGFHAATEVEGALAGFILTLLHRGRGHVITLDVAPEFRRQGVGRRLLAAAERHYARRGVGGMRLEAAVNNHAALRFYARLGYQPVRLLPGYYAADLDGLLLRKDWTPASAPCHN